MMTSSSVVLSNGDTEVLFPSRLFSVRGLVAVITGGGSGIGRMMAAALENNGATVYIVGRRLDVLRATASEISKHGNVIPVEGDVTDRDSLLSIAETVKNGHGYIDLLVNNAGIVRNLYDHPLPSPEVSSPATETPNSPASAPSIASFQASLWNSGSPEGFAETFSTNVTSVYYTTVAFLDLLHQGNLRKHEISGDSLLGSHPRPPSYSSQVISVSSSGGFRLDAKILSLSYTLAKTACTHLGKLLANLLAPWGIRSNVIAPGVFPSEMTAGVIPGVADSSGRPASFIDSVPLKRAGTEEEIAGVILFLASRSGAYVNGAVWLVDGGRVGSLPSSY